MADTFPTANQYTAQYGPQYVIYNGSEDTKRPNFNSSTHLFLNCTLKNQNTVETELAMAKESKQIDNIPPECCLRN
jgi:hypothetical protein